MITENQYAEHGGMIIANTTATTFPRKVIALKCLVETVIASITPDTTDANRVVAGLDWYEAKTLPAGHIVEANIAAVTLTSGAVQAFYQA